MTAAACRRHRARGRGGAGPHGLGRGSLVEPPVGEGRDAGGAAPRGHRWPAGRVVLRAGVEPGAAGAAPGRRRRPAGRVVPLADAGLATVVAAPRGRRRRVGIDAARSRAGA